MPKYQKELLNCKEIKNCSSVLFFVRCKNAESKIIYLVNIDVLSCKENSYTFPDWKRQNMRIWISFIPVPFIKYSHTTEGVKNFTMSNTIGWFTKNGPSIVVMWSCRFEPTLSKARTRGILKRCGHSRSYFNCFSTPMGPTAMGTDVTFWH